MDRTVSSPDLIRIQHAWDTLGRAIGTRKLPPRTIQSLKNRVAEPDLLEKSPHTKKTESSKDKVQTPAETVPVHLDDKYSVFEFKETSDDLEISQHKDIDELKKYLHKKKPIPSKEKFQLPVAIPPGRLNKEDPKFGYKETSDVNEISKDKNTGSSSKKLQFSVVSETISEKAIVTPDRRRISQSVSQEKNQIKPTAKQEDNTYQNMYDLLKLRKRRIPAEDVLESALAHPESSVRDISARLVPIQNRRLGTYYTRTVYILIVQFWCRN
ncbi:hypothetical protein TNCV_34821 [Trichonephila clavipes]|nr:hypothetical protein TNCV_34821 [Trichonephila clavipes]